MRALSNGLKFIDWPIYFFICLILFLSPLPFGSVTPDSLLIIQLFSFFIFTLWLIKSILEKRTPFPSVKPYIPILLFFIVCLFQIVPLPGFVLGLISDKSLEIWVSTRSVLEGIEPSIEMRFFTISVYPNITLQKTLLLLSYLVFGIVVSRSFRSAKTFSIVLFSIFIVMVLEATVGIYQYLSSGGGESARGTFINRNHFAGFIEMSFPLFLGYVLAMGAWDESSEKSFLKRFITTDNLPKQILFLFVLGVILLSVILSKSRGGIFSILISLAFFYIVSSRFLKKGIEIRWMIYLAAAVGFFFAVYIGLFPIIERYLLIEEQLPSRTLIWKDTINIIKDFPVFGSGLGTFSYIFPLYKVSIVTPYVYYYSHNDYLQILTETGIVGFLLLMTALIVFLLSSVRNLIRLSSEEDYTRFFPLLGALTGILSILIHSLVDFNLQIPSNGLYFAFLIGFSVSLGSKKYIE